MPHHVERWPCTGDPLYVSNGAYVSGQTLVATVPPGHRGPRSGEPWYHGRMASDPVAQLDPPPDAPRPRWKVEPSEIPPELSGNEIVQSLTTLTPAEERLLERLHELGLRDP